MCFILKFLRLSIRNNCYLILGLLAGITVSLFTIEFLEDNCHLNVKLETLNSEFASLLITDEYEPRINLAGKPLKAKKTPQEFVRPRYYSTELGIREKLFVGVLTSPKNFETYGVSLNKTLHHVVNKLVFFSEKSSGQRRSPGSVTGLVEFSDFRLILKPFHMLKYIADNFLDEFDYFYIVRDSTFVHGKKLMELAHSLSVSLDVHIGGGKTDHLTSYCSMDGGILLSSLLMRQVTANLDWCVKNAFSDSDDANIGRCIVHATDIPCQESQGGVQYQSHRLISPDLPLDRILKDAALVDAVSVWPVTKPEYFFHLSAFYSKAGLEKTDFEISKLRHAIQNTTVVLPGNRTEVPSWPIGTPPPNTPANRFDLLRWDYFTEKQIFLKTDFSNADDLQGADFLDVQNMLNASIEFLEKKYEGQLIYKRLVNGYRRFDPSRGMDYIVDLAVRDSVTGRESRRRLEICKPLGKVELVPVPYVTESTRVNMVVFATARNKEDVVKFMGSYATVCMEKRDKTSLLLVLIYEADHPGKESKNDVHSAVKAEAVRQSERFRRDNNKITWLSVKLPRVSPPQGLINILLLDLVSKKYSLDNLILICTPNMELRQDYLNRVRMNTVREKQVFSPIPFSEYHPLVVYNEDLPRPKEMDINKHYGHYDVTNMDHISFYVRDFKAARKSIEHLLPLPHTDKDLSPKWHEKMSSLTDSSLYGLFVRHTSLHVLRAVEPSLRLRHEDLDCGKQGSSVCYERRAWNLGPRSRLGRLVLEYHRTNGQLTR